MDPSQVIYEHPLNERTRTLLRLEFMFFQLDHAMRGQSGWDTRLALASFFDILNIINRGELKSDLIKELERHAGTLLRLKQSPGVDPRALESILGEIEQGCIEMRRPDALSLEEVKQNDFLNAVRQRSSIPGGTCRFDLPALHHWLETMDSTQRTDHLGRWIRPLQPLQNALSLLLRLIRESSVPTRETARNGFFQQPLDSNSPTQMLRLTVDRRERIFPEISGGRHRFSIRFLSQDDPDYRATQVQRDIAFSLVCCVI